MSIHVIAEFFFNHSLSTHINYNYIFYSTFEVYAVIFYLFIFSKFLSQIQNHRKLYYHRNIITLCKILHARIQEFSSGGSPVGGGGDWGGGPGQSDKKALTMFVFFSPQLISQKSNG